MNLQDLIDQAESAEATAKLVSQSGRLDPKTFEPRNREEQKLVDAVLAVSHQPKVSIES